MRVTLSGVAHNRVPEMRENTQAVDQISVRNARDSRKYRILTFAAAHS